MLAYFYANVALEALVPTNSCSMILAACDSAVMAGTLDLKTSSGYFVSVTGFERPSISTQ